MTSSNETETASKKPLKLSRPGKLELKKTVDAGQVRQSFPHGRSKTVTVEVKKKRTYARGAGDKMTEVTAEGDAAAAAEAEAQALFEHGGLHHLTEGERATRLKALEEAKRDDEIRRHAEHEAAGRRAEEEARRVAEEMLKPKPEGEPVVPATADGDRKSVV